jgi:hypothetical protein
LAPSRHWADSGRGDDRLGLAYHCTWVAVAVLTLKSQKAVGLPRARTGPDALIEVAGGHMVHH